MEVEYVLFHEERTKVAKMLDALTRRPDGLFNTTWRREHGLSLQVFGVEHSWAGVIVGNIRRVGTHVLHYTVTLPAMYAYPELVAAALIERGWAVKARFRENGDAWTYTKHAFPAGTEYTMPAGWDE